MTPRRDRISRPLLAIIVCGTLSPAFAGDASHGPAITELPPLPSAPAPEEVGAEATRSGPDAVPLPPLAESIPLTTSAGTIDCLPAAPRAINNHAKSDRRCRLCDPNAPAAAMARMAPAGAAVRGIMAAQVANGDAAQFILYEFDFNPREAELNCRGMIKLHRIARQIVVTPFPLLIHPSLVDPALDNARRDAVVRALLAVEPAMTPDRVRLALPPARGLDGLDAVLIHDRLLRLSAGGEPGAGVAAEPSPVAAVPSAR